MSTRDEDVEQHPDGSTRLEEEEEEEEETRELSDENIEKSAKDYAEYLTVNSKQEVSSFVCPYLTISILCLV